LRPPRPTAATPAPGLDNPSGAIPGTLGSSPSGGGATSTPVPQGGTTPGTTPGSNIIQR